jgi:signal transduction histidine kinase
MTDLQANLKPGQQFACSHSGAAIILLDKSLIRKVLINLLTNAIKFSPPQATIGIDSRSGEEGFALAVRDQGIGISEDDLRHLSERFFRGANAGNTQGTGLGLHIVHKYVELMHGTMEIESKLREGTTVRLFFPPVTDTQLATLETDKHYPPGLSDQG